MTRPLRSSQWHRVRGLRPRLRGHVQIHRHDYRGQVWYVFEDRVGGRHHRFNFASYRVVHLMDGRRTMEEIWQLLAARVDDDTPTQDDLIHLLGQLHAADLVQADVTPDVAELLERRGSFERRKWLGRLGNPVALRLPLLDPDALLTRLAAWLRPLSGRAGVALWLVVVLPALVLLPAHWSALTGNFGEQMLGSGNLWLLALLFPLVKVLHEVSHGLACKWHGGEVHETGVMLLAGYPVPFVDVSAASALGSKWQRAGIGAAGMLGELFVAALAFYLWLLLEPGLARSMAWNVAVLASVTTLFFNANPLLRYDGYYILSDLLEIPNLGTRANRHWQYLADRFVFGVRQPERPPATAGERRWFTAYAPLAYVYRLFVSFAIAIFVAQHAFFLGVALGLWTVGQGVLWPLFKGLRALATAPRYADRVGRIRAVGVVAVSLAGLLLFVVPLPFHTTAEGVLWVPERAILRAGSAGFVRELRAEPGAQLAPGDAVLEAFEPGLDARLRAQRARVAEVEAQIDAAWSTSQARVQQLQQQLAAEQGALDRLLEEAQGLTVRAGVGGTLLLQRAPDLPGRWLKKGEVVGYVRAGEPPRVRVVVPQSDVDPVRLATRSVQVRLPQAPGDDIQATLLRAVPAAAKTLPSAVLGTLGGGRVAIDPRDAAGLTTLQSVFEFELVLPATRADPFRGSRVHVRFEHPSEPVGWRALRAVRRLFLSTFEL